MPDPPRGPKEIPQTRLEPELTESALRGVFDRLSDDERSASAARQPGGSIDETAFPGVDSRAYVEIDSERIVSWMQWEGPVELGTSAPAATGERLGEYEVRALIGRGGMGEVYRVHDRRLNRDLALKVMRWEADRHPDLIRRFIEEAQITGQLQHPGIPPVFERGILPDGRHYYALKLVKGQTLATLLASRGSSKHPPEPCLKHAATAKLLDPSANGWEMADDSERALGPPPAAAKAASPSPLPLPSPLPSPSPSLTSAAGATGVGATDGSESPPDSPPGAAAAGSGRETDLPRLLAIFEQIAQAVAYAHSKGVIHRDLKPSNIMLGAFGEVQVMDWGLAKVIGRGEDASGSHSGMDSRVRSVRTEHPSTAWQTGVIGTPAYMPPEQARGYSDAMDARSDVFALGSILCELLTGRAAYASRSTETAFRDAVEGNLSDAYQRLHSCDADPELVALAWLCLSPDPANRPADATAVSQAIAQYRRDVEERLRSAELAQAEHRARIEEARRTAAEAQAKARAERRARLLTVGLAATVMAGVGLVLAGWSLREAGRRAAARQVDESYAALVATMARARAAGDDLSAWREAAASARGFERQLATAGVRADLAALARDLRKEADRMIEEAVARAEADRRDQILLDRLVQVRNLREEVGAEGTLNAFLAAFREYGIDPIHTDDPATSAERVASRPEAVRVAIASALDEWAILARDRGEDAESWRRPLTLANQIDPEPTRRGLRAAWAEGDSQALRDLARDRTRFEALGPQAVVLLAQQVGQLDGRDAAIAVLRQGILLHPHDVWVNFQLASLFNQHGPEGRSEAIGFFRVARALQPGTGHDLAHLLENRGNGPEATAIFRELVELHPDDARHLTCYALHLQTREQREDALAIFDRAIAAGRAQLAREPDNAAAYWRLGIALRARGRADDAIAAYETAIRLNPQEAQAYANLGTARVAAGDAPGAIAAFREAIRRKPDEVKSRVNLGITLAARGDREGAIAAYREAIAVQPDYAPAYFSLGNALQAQGQIAEAIAAYREAIRLKPDHAAAQSNLGGALLTDGQPDAAADAFREAIRLKPDYAAAHSNLGFVLLRVGDVDGAVAALREALRLNPSLIDAHVNLGEALEAAGDHDAAADAFRQAVRLRPNRPETHLALGLALRHAGRFSESRDALTRAQELGADRQQPPRPTADLVADVTRLMSLEPRLEAVLAGDDAPQTPEELVGFAELCRRRDRPRAAVGFWQRAFAERPEWLDDPERGDRYPAAAAAVVAASGPSHAEPSPDAAEQAALRAQALAWLQAETDAWAARLNAVGPSDPLRERVAEQLNRWRIDRDLASVRDPDALASLPETERAAWNAFWAKVAALRTRALARP